MSRVHNYFAGPAALPLPALEQAQKELLDWAGTGMSVMETSHRSKEYSEVHGEAINLLKELLGLGEEYKVLFCTGGASMQFAMAPLNLLRPGDSADYILTGSWAKKAYQEAKLIGQARVAASTESEKFARLPRPDEMNFDPRAKYVHLTSNNTIYGSQWREFPDTKGIPIVADMSSDLLWRPFDIKSFGLIYAGAQKNLGPAGVTIVILRQDLLEQSREDLPTMLRYRTFWDNDSLANTPPVFCIYMVRNVLRWIKDTGGLVEMERRNLEKGALLYRAIDESGFYRCPVEPGSRSVMNACFRLPTEELDQKFVSEAKKAGFIGLKGYRTMGGIRVSMYNAVGPDSIRALVAFMQDFREENQ